MEFSIWNKLDAATDGSPWVEMLVTDTKGNPIEDKWFWVAHAEDYQHGFLRMSIPFEIKDTSHRFIFKLKPGKGHRFERMMIRPAGVYVFDTTNNKRYVNAYMLD
jgi:penicillin-binding protein-related factor A (putative recombinase)